MSPTTNNPLDLALSFEALGEGRFGGSTSEAYWNMAGPFGGVTAATLIQAVLLHPQRRGRPIALTTNFCGAIASGGFEVAARLVRDGRSTQHWQVEMAQEGVVTTTASVVTGAERDTWSFALSQAPEMPTAAELEPMATAGRSGWLGRYEFRYERGEPMRNAAATKENPGPALSQAWVRDEPPRPLDYLSLAALSDSFVVKILPVRGDLPPVATVSLSTYFMADSSTLLRQGDRPVIAQSNSRVFRHGFNDQSAELWSDANELLAVSHQVVWSKG